MLDTRSEVTAEHIMAVVVLTHTEVRSVPAGDEPVYEHVHGHVYRHIYRHPEVRGRHVSIHMS